MSGEVEARDGSRAMRRACTRKMLSMGVQESEEEGKLTDAKAKAMKTAESFHSLMTMPTTDVERAALRAKYSLQADHYRRQIRQQRRCTLDPNGRWMSKWDVVTSLALLFTATVTPLEVCLLDGDAGES